MDAFGALAELPLTIGGYELSRQSSETSSEFTRDTTTITLYGNGYRGHGEDVTYATEDHDALLAWDDRFPLQGHYTFSEYSQQLGNLDLFPSNPPDRDIYRNYRRWGFESAGLDLALRQQGTHFAEALGEQYSPVRFLVSTRLGDPPSITRIQQWLGINPDLQFKLDPTSDWTPTLIDGLAETGAVQILDLKGQYSGINVDQSPDPDLYDRIVTAFPNAIIEDPAITPQTRSIISDHTSRVSWDLPITDRASILELPYPPEWINIKPSRFGSVESLFETIAYCHDQEITMYGGGQFELGVGRGPLHALASVFYPDGPNDVAPVAYNQPTPQPGLPTSPLNPPNDPDGFAWE